jgi:predicted nucleic acid-binding protein
VTSVLDASAAIDLLLPTERHAAAAIAITRGGRLIAPAIIDLEVAQALRKLERAGSAPPGVIAGAWLQWTDHPIRRVMPTRLLASVYEFREYVWIPDGFYVALARVAACPLITSDRRLATAHGLGVPVVAIT